MSLLRRSILSLVLVLFTSASAYATAAEASNFINDLANRVITIIKDSNVSASEKEAKLDSVFLQAVDTKWIARFALGRYWRSITPAQQAQYLDLYSKYLSSIYVPNFRKYTGNIVTVLNATKLNSQEYLVHTEMTDAAKTMDLKIDYHLMQDESGIEKFIIFDIIAEGVSLITTQRAEVGSVMADGNFDSLVTLLTQKTYKQENN